MTERKIIPFNPLEKKHLGESVGQGLLRNPAEPMADIKPFKGAGLYALYYSGEFDAYEALAERNRTAEPEAPIYVGKAVPKGARKGDDLESSPGKVLFNRLKEHRRSLEQAENLAIEDFTCRYLVVDDIWIPLGESLLISRFFPLWNRLVDGFGNHAPGKGRYKGVKPRWDVLHPGRPWAERCEPRDETAEQIVREVKEFLRNNPPPKDPWEIT